jgi:hypothetical protein
VVLALLVRVLRAAVLPTIPVPSSLVVVAVVRLLRVGLLLLRSVVRVRRVRLLLSRVLLSLTRVVVVAVCVWIRGIRRVLRGPVVVALGERRRVLLAPTVWVAVAVVGAVLLVVSIFRAALAAPAS